MREGGSGTSASTQPGPGVLRDPEERQWTYTQSNGDRKNLRCDLLQLAVSRHLAPAGGFALRPAANGDAVRPREQRADRGHGSARAYRTLFVLNSISLVIDAVDVTRYFAGDRAETIPGL